MSEAVIHIATNEVRAFHKKYIYSAPHDLWSDYIEENA